MDISCIQVFNRHNVIEYKARPVAMIVKASSQYGLTPRLAGSSPVGRKNFHHQNVGRQGRVGGGIQFLITRLRAKSLD